MVEWLRQRLDLPVEELEQLREDIISRDETLEDTDSTPTSELTPATSVAPSPPDLQLAETHPPTAYDPTAYDPYNSDEFSDETAIR